MAKIRKDSFIAFKCTSISAARLREAARARGVKLSAFVRRAAETAAEALEETEGHKHPHGTVRACTIDSAAIRGE